MPSIDPKLKVQIDEATAALASAEKELENLMRTIESTERAEKKMIGEVLKDAFQKLAIARAKLDGLRDPSP